MFAQPTTSQPSEESSYIIKQNESLHAECRKMREEIVEMQKAHTAAMQGVQLQHDALEEELDKADASMRYLRNLQRTLATLHVDCKRIADGYKACDHDTEQHYKAQAKRYKAVAGMALGSYALTFTTALLVDLTSSMAVCATTGAGMYGAYVWLTSNKTGTAGTCQEKSKARRKELSQKTKEYEDAVRGLPGIEELIDSA